MGERTGLPLSILIGVALILGACNDTGVNNTTDEPDVFVLSTTATPTEGGAINPSSGQYDKEMETPIEAVAADGFVFVRWSGDLNGNTDNPTRVVWEKDMTITAIFSEKTYQLDTQVKGNGRIWEEVVEEPTASKTEYQEGTKVKLSADPADGWEFSHWEGDHTGETESITLVVNEAMEITAVFVEKADKDDDSSDSKDDEKGDDDKKSDDGKDGKPGTDGKDGTDGADGKDGKHGTDGKDGKPGTDGKDGKPGDKPDHKPDDKGDDKKDDDKPKHVTLHRSIEGSGTVWWEPHNETDKIPEGTELTIGANEADGWECSHWEGDYQGKQNPIRDAKIDRDKSFTAVFTQKEPEPDPEPEEEVATYTITLKAEGGGGFSINGSLLNSYQPQEFEEGTTVEIEVHPGNKVLSLGGGSSK